MNEQIRNLLDQIRVYLAQPLLLNSELEAIKDQLNKIVAMEPEAYDETHSFLAAIARAKNQASLLKRPSVNPSENFFDVKTFENFFSNYYLPTDIQTIIFNATNSFAEAALLGRTCKTLYNHFLTKYQLKEFEAIPLKSVNNTLFFHTEKQTPVQFLASLQTTHIESNKKLASFFNPQPVSIFNAKKIVGVVLFLIAIYCIYDCYNYLSKIDKNLKAEREGLDTFKNPVFWQITFQFLRFLFPLVLGVFLCQRGVGTALGGFTRNNDLGFRTIDSTIESRLRYRNQQIETTLENEITKIIKSLKQAVNETRQFQNSYDQTFAVEKSNPEEISAPKPKWI